MPEVAKKYVDQLPRIMKSVKNAYSYWQPNYKTFNDFRRFVFDTSLTEDDKMVLSTLKKPEIEFNILEAYISRLRGEFAKQEPSIVVMADDGAQIDSQTIELVGAHLRHILFDANKNGCEYNVYTDLLSGGYSAIKVWTEYAHSMSMNQIIRFERVYDPTLVGFDPLAREPHKGDGRFCFELFPKSKEEFEDEYPDIDLREINFTRNVEGFNWSYANNQEDILLICDFYEKKKRRKKIVELVNGKVMTIDDYEDFLQRWNSDPTIIEQAPAVKGKPRWTDIETICRYRFIQNHLLEYIETNYPQLPIIFVDGNSIVMRHGDTGSFIQKTRPYVYHAKGMQQLKNFAGQTLANELENMVQHKFIVAKEALPDEQAYLDAYTNVQIANTLVFKAFKENDPKVPIPSPIREVARVGAPAEVMSSFTVTDQMAQSILGSYDASLGINDNQLSGTAIIEGATQSNATAMPYVVGFLQALSQVARIIVDLIPKYYMTARTIPIIKPDGSRDYQKINQQGGIDINYDQNALSVKVEAGVNFAVQKSRALQQIIAMTQVSPIFQQFINAKGLKVIIDNFEIKGSEQLKELADEFMQEMQKQQEQQQQMQQQQMQNDPMVLKAKNEQMKIQMQGQQDAQENQLKAAQVAINKQQVDIDFVKVLAEMNNAKAEQQVAESRSQAEETRAAVDLAIKHADMAHSHGMSEKTHELDEKKLMHEMTEARKDASV
jgi:hypothetical protein